MIDISRCQEHFNEVIAFAEETDQLDKFRKELDYLNTYADHEREGRTKCVLFQDFAPYSFTFSMMRKNKHTGEYEPWFNGGFIYHGSHDGGGNGGAPTFSVCLNPVNGWAVHT